MSDENLISQQARDGFDLLLQQALKGSLVAPDQACEIALLDDDGAIEAKKMVVLTVSSYLFRVMVMFYFTPDAATRAYFAQLNRVAPEDLDEQGFMDAIAECGNLCCGILNRDLGQFFPHLGMSTPNVIDRQCAAYLQTLNLAHLRHFVVTAPDAAGLPEGAEAPRFFATLSVSAWAEIDFSVSAEQADTSTGELELF